jgi:hypothetical protein
MTGRAGRGGRGGRNYSKGRGRGRGQNYTGTSSSTKKGLNDTLGGHVFDYGQKAAADQMRTSWEKITEYVGATYGQDISNELQNKITVTIPEPTHTADVLNRNLTRSTVIRNGQNNLQKARKAGEVIVQAAVTAGVVAGTPDAKATMDLATLQNEIAAGNYELSEPIPLQLTDSEKTQYSNEWRTYRDRNSSLIKYRGQAYSLILGQCSQLLKDKMKQDIDWGSVSISYDPLTLYRLIEKTILAQTEDQYPFATVYDQELSFYSFRQPDNMNNPQYYERFNTKVDVGEAIGVTRQHKSLLEHVAQELPAVGGVPVTFDSLTPAQQLLVRDDAEERYLSYAFLRQSGPQHGKLKTDLQNDFTTGDNHYPKTRQQTLHLLDKYSKSAVTKPISSEGASFAQGGGGGNGKNKKKEPFDKVYWKGKTCYNCNGKDHPASHCKADKADKKEDDDDASTASSVNKLKKDFKKMSKAFTTVNAKLEQLKEHESDLSGSDAEEEDSHFQFQFAQLESEFEPRISNLFKQTHGNGIALDLKEIILLDSQSTMDLFCSKVLVDKTFKSKNTMKLKSNGGSMLVNQKATIFGYHKEVWFSTRAITNIIALSNLIQQYRVTYDSNDLMFVVHREPEKPNMDFRMHESGLHYYDPRKEKNEEMIFVNTVAENMANFTKREIKEALVAKALYSTLDRPSMTDFKWIVRNHQIKDSPVTITHVDNAISIWGKSVSALQGKTTRKKSIPVTRDYIKIPRELMRLHQEVFLTIDIFFVNKIPFLLSLSRKIHFTAVQHLANRTVPNIFKAFKEIYQYYLQRGFHITTIHADGEFAPLKILIESMPNGPLVNLASANEHVPEIERRIRVVKERSRGSRHELPYSRIPKLMTIYMVFNNVKMLNYFPPKGGISTHLSPKTIISGEVLDYKKHLCLPFGQYCQVHEEETPRNSQAARTKAAISLGPSGNLQGGYRFMALDTGKKITRRNWDVIPITELVIARVNALGKDQPEVITFTDRHGATIGNDSTDDFESTNHVEFPGVDRVEFPGVDRVDPVISDDIEIPGVDIEQGPEDPVSQEDIEEIEIDDVEIHEPDPHPIQEEIPPIQVETVQEETTVPIPNLRRSSRVKIQTDSGYIPSMTGSKYGYAVTQLEKYGVLHPDAHMFTQGDFYQSEPDVVAMVMTQLSLKAGLKAWGAKARTAAHNEMKQLHLRDTFKPWHWKHLTHTQRQMVLESHMFLKLKRDGRTKARTVAGGNKQRNYISKEDSSSPTVATESVLLTCIIDAEEGRDVAVIDIPNAFIQTRVEEEKDMSFIILRGVLVDILVEIAPEAYRAYAYKDKKGVPCLLVQCQNALYGTMVASLLYYRKFAKSLTDIGFVINPYDPCVANKIISRKQMTVCWHVDDLKASHKNVKVMDKMIEFLRHEYESIFEDGSGAMVVSRGKVHKYLGMTLDFRVRGQVKVSMFDYIEEILTAFEKAEPNCAGTKSSAAPVNLFTVNEDCEKISDQKAVEFHNLVAKTLYATKRARPDTCTAIAFLTTRVRAPDKDDWKKLVHLMCYIRGSRKMPLILSANGSHILKWWVDASFAVHPNMRGHSGGCLSMGRGMPVVGSNKQKLNTRSSTGAEIVGADDFMPSICWTRYFMEAQGYKIDDNILYQDNKSAILLEKNGKASSSKRTKHINIRYFFITDRIQKKELSVEWCPTENMIGDYATKPLQGAAFKKFRDYIMGVVPIEDSGPRKSEPIGGTSTRRPNG